MVHKNKNCYEQSKQNKAYGFFHHLHNNYLYIRRKKDNYKIVAFACFISW